MMHHLKQPSEFITFRRVQTSTVMLQCPEERSLHHQKKIVPAELYIHVVGGGAKNSFVKKHERYKHNHETEPPILHMPPHYHPACGRSDVPCRMEDDGIIVVTEGSF